MARQSVSLPNFLAVAALAATAMIATFFFAATKAANAQTAQRQAVEHIVVIKDFKFSPARLDVRPGDRITWKNSDIVPHTATAGDQSWDSGEIAQGASYSLIVKANQRGAYFCRFHPMMRAALKVERK